MFGMVLATGIRILSRVNYSTNRYNLYIVAISLGIGMIPVVSPQFFSQLPVALQPLLHSDILLTTVSAVGLNYYFNGYHPESNTDNSPSDEAEVEIKEKTA